MVLREAKIKQVLVPANFPFSHASRLLELGYQVHAKPDPFYEQRVVKTAEEVRHIESAQRATEELSPPPMRSAPPHQERTLWLWRAGGGFEVGADQ